MPRTRPPFADKAIETLEQISKELRLNVVDTALRTKRPLAADSLAIIDVLVALYWQCLRTDPRLPDDPGRDRFVFNHPSPALAFYVTLAKRGFFPIEELEHYDELGGHLPQQLAPHTVPGVEWGCSSTRHGLSVALGMALSAQIQSRSANIFVLLDETDCSEGIVSESAALAARLALGNLTAIVTSQQTPGTTRNRAAAKMSLAAKWQSVGWQVQEVDGHDLSDVSSALQLRKNETSPVAVIANVERGKGLSFTSTNEWMDRVPTPEELEMARKELGS